MMKTIFIYCTYVNVAQVTWIIILMFLLLYTNVTLKIKNSKSPQFVFTPKKYY